MFTNPCFSSCPSKRGWQVCTCDMAGEECAVIDWQIAKQENKLSKWNLVAHLTLAFFGCGIIEKEIK